MENEMWDDAVSELERSLSLKRRVLDADDRQVAQLHYQLATACVARMEKAKHDAEQPGGGLPPLPLPGAAGASSSADAPPPSADELRALATASQQKALEHFRCAADVLGRRLAALPAAAEGAAAPAELTELTELLAEIGAKIEEQQQLGAAAAAAAAEGGEGGQHKRPLEAAATGNASAGVTTIGFGECPSAGVTTIGFGEPAGAVTTIGFGEPAGAVTTIGFGGAASGGAASAALPVKNLGVAGGKGGVKRVRLE